MKSERDEALKEVSRGLGELERRDLADGKGERGHPKKGEQSQQG